MSKYEEVIKRIREQQKQIGIDYTNGKDCTVICFLDKDAENVIDALEKQVPKKPILIIDNNSDEKWWDKCPVCGETMIEIYCSVCGQLINRCDEE